MYKFQFYLAMIFCLLLMLFTLVWICLPALSSQISLKHPIIKSLFWVYLYSYNYYMPRSVTGILKKENLSREDILFLLGTAGDEKQQLFQKSAETKQKYVGNKVFYRGLIEFSNICSKNCLYCGIRKDNS